MREYTLVGTNGNAYAVIGYVRGIMKLEGFSVEEIEAYTKRAKSMDYDNLLYESRKMVDLCNENRKKRREEL